MERPIYMELAALLVAQANCRKSGNTEWLERHGDRISELMRNAPSGSGFDSGTKLDADKSKPDKLVFTTSFHHMDESGGYDGWTDHEVIVRPSLMSGFDLRITGRDRNGIKEYIAEIFHSFLTGKTD